MSTRNAIDKDRTGKENEQSILAEMKKIQANFDAALLAPDTWKKTTKE